MVDIMGGKQVIKQPVHNTLDFLYLSQKEQLSIEAIRSIQRLMKFTNKEMSEMLSISESTLQRRYNSEVPLSKDEAEKAFHITKVIARGMEVYGSLDDFLAFLHANSRALGNIKPIEIMSSSIGRDEILNLLGRIEWGMYS
jgi:putative toxin-antitoxin system antitoxin component (TIGR02293 family)